MLKIKVKVGKVTNLSDARYCAGMGVDLLGFPIGSHDGIDPKKYKEITDWVSVPGFVLEWTEAEIPNNFEDILQLYNAHFIQIDARQLQYIPPLKIPLIVILKVTDWSTYHQLLKSNKGRIGYLIVMNPKNSLPDPLLIAPIASEFSVLLGFDISANNLGILTSMPVVGISLEGTEESTPGLKDYSHLSEILERLELTEE